MPRPTPYLRTDKDKSLIVMYCDRCRKIRFFEPTGHSESIVLLTCKGCGDQLFAHKPKEGGAHDGG